MPGISSMVTPLCSHCSVLKSLHPSPCLIGPFARMVFPGDREAKSYSSAKRGVSMASSGAAPLPCASVRKLESWGQHRPSYWSSCRSRSRSLGFEGTTRKFPHFPISYPMPSTPCHGSQNVRPACTRSNVDFHETWLHATHNE